MDFSDEAGKLEDEAKKDGDQAKDKAMNSAEDRLHNLEGNQQDSSQSDNQ